MMNWARKGLGLKEEIHGAEAVKSVALQTQETPYTVTTKEDHKWVLMEETNVETKTFYIFGDDGRIAMFQVVYSSLLGMKKTATVNVKLFSKESGKPHFWDTDELKTWDFPKDKLDFKGEYSSAELSEDGQTYTLKTKNAKVNAEFKFTQSAPGFKAGKDGTTLFGKDFDKPWGRMIHNFWPRCKAEGSVTIDGVTTQIKGLGMYAYALQGMKPHFAASKWNFFVQEGPTYSALIMEFTTPPSYANTVVAIGAVAKDGEIVFAGASPATNIQYTSTKVDKSNKLPEPTAVTYTVGGKSTSGQSGTATTSGPLQRIDLVDIMGALPPLVRSIAQNASGTKPYIYQYSSNSTLSISFGGQDTKEAAIAFMEATFIHGE